MNHFIPPSAFRFVFLILALGPAKGSSACAERSLATLPLGQVSGTIPFARGFGNLILVPARINGQGPCLFILDSGAGAIFLDKSLAEELGLKTHRRGATHAIGPKSIAWRQTNEATIQIGTASLARQKLVVAEDFGPVEALFGQDVRGSLGWDPFMNFVVRIDPAQKTVTLSLPTLEHFN